jgi:hypothetical protein
MCASGNLGQNVNRKERKGLAKERKGFMGSFPC